jgi:starch phosphorylase
MVRSAADLKIPLVGVTLLHRQGYFRQRLDGQGWQHEEPASWTVEEFLQVMPVRTAVLVEGRPVHLQAWRYEVRGLSGFTVPVYFLDADLAENTAWDRTLTHVLYGGDARYRLCQEVLLGMGGVKMLRALGYTHLDHFHMNEGHSSLLTLELLAERLTRLGLRSITQDDIDAVRAQCVFTTHTPVPAGHDQFPLDLVQQVLGPHEAFTSLQSVFCCDGMLNMTYLGLNLSHYINGVAKKHGEVARHMFASYVIDSITNGVHVGTWTAPAFQTLFDCHIPGWREDNFSLRYALSLPRQEVWEAHMASKRTLLDYVNRTTNASMEAEVFTLGFARRATPYKRADLLFADLDRLQGIAARAGRLQVVYAGKAHPHDYGGKELIARLYQAQAALTTPDITMVYLPDYDMALGKLLTAGADVWLNTPQPPLEASGTSGMKAALNGVPSLSVLDGWWIEGCIEGVTGWAIGENHRGLESIDDRSQDAVALYDKLEQVVLPMFSRDRERFLNVMLHAIALNGSFFNTQRMMQQYVVKAYFL